MYIMDSKIIMIFGGTGVLCRAIGNGLAEKNNTCILIGRNKDNITNLLEHPNIEFLKCDVTKVNEIHDVYLIVYNKYKQIDVVINGMGINSQQPLLSIEPNDIHMIMDVNFNALFCSCQEAYKHMHEHGGCIINLGSVSGIIPLSKVFIYSCSKAAVHSISKNLAREWGKDNIRVNTLIPGFFPAEQNKKILTPERTQSILQHTPLQRFGDPKELIEPVWMICNASYMTGSEIIVDGGFSCQTI